jgi:hypothetical protein
MSVDAAGNVYNTENMESGADMDSSAVVFNLMVNTIDADAFLQTLYANGNFVWAKQLKGADAYIDNIRVEVDASGYIYVSGVFVNVIDCDPSAAADNIAYTVFFDGFILKLDASGNFDWVKTFGAANEVVELISLTLDNANNIILGGNFSGSIDFDVSASTQILTAINSDGFVLKLDATGGFTYVKQLITNSYTTVSSIDINATNNIYIGGLFFGTLDLDPSTRISNVSSANNSAALYFLKLSR